MIPTRVAALQLMADLVASGPTRDLLPFVAASDDLSGALESSHGPVSEFDEQTLDLLAAEHQRVLGFGVFSHQSAFLDESGLLGGDEADTLFRLYADLGLQLRGGEEPDHLASILRVLATLLQAEATADEDEQAALPAARRELLDQHLLHWLPTWTLAVKAEGSSFYAALAELVVDLVMEERRHISLAWKSDRPQPDPLDAEAFLERGKTSLRDIAEYLVTVARSGLWLSRTSIQTLGREHNVPRGFGERRRTVQTMLESAAQFDALEDLSRSLLALIDEQKAGLGGFRSTEPRLDPFLAPWEARLDGTRQLVRRLKDAAHMTSDET